MTLILGSDEAGRGPVIGPLIIAGVVIDKDKENKLKELGVKDSKLLTRKKREELFDEIAKIVKYKIIQVDPIEIDKELESEDSNLNWLEAKKTAIIINKLKPGIAYLDCPSPNKEAYTNYIKNLLDYEVEVISEHKAEDKYPVVAAASILAKVTRDLEMDKIKEKYGDTGPGYTSNEKTQKFLKENWSKHREIFRTSWVSWKKLEKGKNQKNLDEF